ncbi:MAG: TspO/MBR family protein [Acidobacteriota bacterium]
MPKHLLALAGFLVAAFAAGAFGAQFTPGPWYEALNRPSWNPPNWIFGPVWTVLYILIATSAWLVWRQGKKQPEAPTATALATWTVQLVLNALWSWIFFGLHQLAGAFAEVCLLWIAIALTIGLFGRVHKLAAWLLVPYLAWVSFAAFLNFTIWRLNP